MESEIRRAKARLWLTTGVPLLGVLLAIVYLMVRITLFIVAGYGWTEKIVGFWLLLAEGFMLLHGVGYFLEIWRVASAARGNLREIPEQQRPESYPPVAVIVSSYREPIPVVENTVTCFYNLTYPNKQIYFLDDTRYDLPNADPKEMAAYRAAVEAMCRRVRISLFRRKWHGAKAGMINDFLAYLNGEQREGFSFQPFGKEDRSQKPKYVIVFDADFNPLPGFVEPLVAKMEKDPRMAFVQTPQYYTNIETNRVALASGMQQAVFYEYICEGKSLQDAMFCCGTNVIFRREALMDVGGFDESSVTEDFATSFKFHARGWHSAYLNQVSAFGMGPEDLEGYFKQQFRWALGTVGLFRKIAGQFFRNPGILSPVKWWEYLLSGTYYFIGYVFLILVLCPLLYLFFDLPSYFARPEIYALFFIPYFMVTMLLYGSTLSRRYYRLRDILVGQLLIGVTFPIYIKAATLGILGVKGKFAVTNKGGSTSLPLRALWPQLLLLCAVLAGAVWGVNRIYYERQQVAAVAVNAVWCLYHFGLLVSVFYFNQPDVPAAPQSMESSPDDLTALQEGVAS